MKNIDLAKKIESAETWDKEDCAVLCAATGLKDEWNAADGDAFENVVFEAIARTYVEDIDGGKRLSIDNGASYIDADDEDSLRSAIEAIGMNAIASMMDDETRERAAAELAPCSDVTFIRYYLKTAAENLIIG